MVELIPAVLPKSFAELGQSLEFLRGVAPRVQVDLVGVNILAGQSAMPLWKEFDFEFDIMLPDPRAVVQDCIDMGASSMVVHVTATETATLGVAKGREALQMLQDKRGGDPDRPNDQGHPGVFPIEVGVALRSHDTPEALEDFKNLYDYVQVMGIDHEGRQGEPPDPHHKEIELVRALRAKFPNLMIQVDGAVAPHVRELVAAGANRLVVGSALTQAPNPNAVYKALYTEANRE